MARPTIYSQEIADTICTRIGSSAEGLRRICDSDDMPGVSTVMRWLKEKPEFREQYTQARIDQAHYLVDQIVEISDDGSNDLMTITKGKESYETENKEVTNRSRLRVDTRKWLASKLFPKMYGDKIDHTTDGEKINFNVTIPK